MEPKVNYVLVGLFVLVLGAITLVMGLWLGKGDYRAVYERYYAYMQESVAGLSINAPVKYHGVEVGYVTEIILNPENSEEVRVTLGISRGTPIKEDTVATLHIQGLTGFAIVDLAGGSREAAPLRAKPGDTYPVIQTAPSLFARLDEAGSRLITNLNRMTEGAGTLLDEETRTTFRQIVTDLATVSRSLANRSQAVDRGMVKAAQAAENLATLTKTMNQQLPDLLDRVDEGAVALQDMTMEVSKTSAALGTLIKEARPNIDQFSRQTLPETALLVSELRQAAATLTRVARQMEQDPSSLIYGRTPQPRGPGE
jgi:phospholipid/cholesterol/gamma-HCH transport system substrate-binding protein